MDRINLKRVAELMNRCCSANLNVADYEGKYLVPEGNDWTIKDDNEK